MALRLILQMDDEIMRFTLPPGELVLGAADDCDLRVPHFTVSRRHAVLRCTAGEVVLEDLGSSNGTTVDGQRLQGAAAVGAGQAVTFGSVGGRIEEVGEEDLEPAVSFGSAVKAPESDTPAGNLETFTVGSLKAFAFHHLPEVLHKLDEGADTTTAAQTAGAALFSALPCTEVEVVDERLGIEAVIFSAGIDEPGCADPVVVTTRDGVTVKARFPHSAQAESYGPLVESAALLIGLAGRRSENGIEAVTAPPKPSPPDPPTVVSMVERLYHDAAKVAASDISVLISGESGTGKEVLARFIHAASHRAVQPLATLNCAALPRDLLESELFGVEEGVATGVTKRPGKFEAAHGGTLFLDEIGDMAPETQARILRVLQEGEVYRLGGREPRPADVRIISATNKNLDALMAAGAFRRDLFHRIADWQVTVPPLRQRSGDIANLAAHFLLEETAKRGVRATGISRGAVATLDRYSWPGNIRQLQREMARSALFIEDGELLETRHLQEAIRGGGAPISAGSLRETLEATERAEIERAIAATDGDTLEASKRLGMSRSTLYRRMKDLEVRR
ncbi:MAG: sigma 54-interacting transcriptional regulator [Thermoanaerobaculales bacterium]|jgi:hypothetical protein|nr:sigma 54-interacting transcriptional regulator [Thermoanaerobaculales bacterium]